MLSAGIMNSRVNLQNYYNNSFAIRQEIQRFESVHPSIYAIYDLIELIPDPVLSQQIREHVVCIEDSFVHSQEWTVSRGVPDLRLGIVGSLSSGKSALVHRYLTGSYMQEESPEGGRFKKEIVIDGQSFLLLIRDEGGPPELQFTAWVDAVIFVFSLENESSFNAIYNYYAKMAQYRSAIDIPLILVGTQDAISATNPRVIEDARARKLASDLKRCAYYETCATYGLNVERVFQDACQKIVGARSGMLTPNNSRPSTPIAPARGVSHFPSNGHHSVSQDRPSSTSSSPNHQGSSPFSPQTKDSLVMSTSRPLMSVPSTMTESLSALLKQPTANKDQKDLPTPSSTPTTSRKSRRRSNLFNPGGKKEEEKKVGSGRAIPLKQGYLYKRSEKPLNMDSWKKKYVTLCDDGRLTYHPSLHDYMEDVHGKEISLQYTTVKVPGQMPGARASRTLQQISDLGGNNKKSADRILLTAYEVIKDGNNEDGIVIPNNNAMPNDLDSKLDTPNIKKRHRRIKSSGTKPPDCDDSDGYEFVIVSLDSKQWQWEALTADERDDWVSAIEQQILCSLQSNLSCKSQGKLGDAATVQSIRTRIAGNTHCVDCDAPNPDWASLNLGALMCIECSGAHRNLGVHISRVRSLDLDEWPPGHLGVMLALGNRICNSIWEGNLSRGRSCKPTPNSSQEEKERWIRSKYEQKDFLAPLPATGLTVPQQLIEAVKLGDVPGVCWALGWAKSDDVNVAVNWRDGRSALLLACAQGSLPIVQLLIWANADATAVDSEKQDCVTLARMSGSKTTPELLELLLSSGCHPLPSSVI